MIRVIIADDHMILRQGLVKILESDQQIEVIGESADGLETLRQVESLQPDVLVLDINMPHLSGLEVVRRVSKSHPTVKVVMLSMHEEEEFILKTVRSGAAGYLLKDSAAAELITAIRSVAQGKAYFSPEASRVLAESYREVPPGKEDPYDRLNNREKEILQMIAEGKTSKAISELLFISPKTVENHRSNLMKKLNLHSATELVRWALKKGLVE